MTPDISVPVGVIPQGNNTPLVDVDGHITKPIDIGKVEDSPAIITTVDPVTNDSKTLVVIN